MIDDKKISDANNLTMSAAQYADAERGDSRDRRALSRADIDADADRGRVDSEAMLARLQQVLGELQGASSAGAAGSHGSALSSDSAALGQAFAKLIDAGVDRPPLPGSGNGATLARWRMLAAVAGTDVSLVKLYEGHTDALAILAELHGDAPPPGTRWAVWAAEPPNARLTAGLDARSTSSYTSISSTSPTHGDAVRLDGTKAWCSGAAHVTHALVTAWLNGQPCLVSVAMDQPGVTVTRDGWQARGMAATGSVDVRFEAAMGTLVGAPGAYLSRPGFWHGGAGIAACWMGATAAIARYTLQRLAAKARPRTTAADGPASPAQTAAPTRREEGSPSDVVIDDLSALYVAELDLAMAAATTLLRDIASEIDRFPAADARAGATRARLDIEALAERVLRTAGRALGAAPLCRDAHFAALMTDLPVFLRQSHAERDLAAYGRAVLESVPQHAGHQATGESRWTL